MREMLREIKIKTFKTGFKIINIPLLTFGCEKQTREEFWMSQRRTEIKILTEEDQKYNSL